MLANLPSRWSTPEIASGVLPAHAVTSEEELILPTVLTVAIESDTSNPNYITFSGNVTDGGNSPVTERGFVWSTLLDPTLTNGNVVPVGNGLGSYETAEYFAFGTYYGCAYATNSAGTAYGVVISFDQPICLVEETLIAMANGTTKKIEDIKYSDRLSVWNFDEGRFDEAQPLFIKVGQVVKGYCLLEFSDGSSLKVVNQHRIFNKEAGMFTYTMSEDTPIGTTTFNIHGQEIKLVSTRVVDEVVSYYNIIAYRHMNLFANSILTSSGYNNIYPIENMKFVKDQRELIPQEQYGVDGKYYEGLRLAEQTIPAADTIAYINRLEKNKVGQEETEKELVFA